jgi:predicted RND superfamily exporter protein
MQRAMIATLRPCIIGGTTTAAAFFALVVCDYRGISEFGLLAGVGVLITLAVTFLTLPPLAIFLTGRGNRTPRDAPATRLQVSPLLAAGLLLCVLAFAGLSAVLAPRLRFHNDLKKMREGSDVEAFYDEVTAAIGGPLDPTIVLVDDVKQARVVERAARRQIEAAKGELPDEIGRVLSIASLVPDATERKLPILAQIQQLVHKAERGPLKKQDRRQLDRLLSLAKARPWSVDEVPEPIRRRFETLDRHKTLVLLWPRRYLNTDVEIGRWVARIERLKQRVRRSGVEVVVLDEKRVLSRVTTVIRADVPPMMLAAAFTVLVILVIHFRGIGRVMLVYGALGLGMLSMLGLMALFEIDLTMFNVIVLPMVVGIGIDNAVHILHGYDTLGRGSVAQVVETVGRAALLASATTAIGFGAIVVAHQHGIKMLGVLAVLGVWAVFAATTVALPSLLIILERLRGAPGGGVS